MPHLNTYHLFFTTLISLGILITPLTQADLNEGLVAYYEFEGNANDSSGHGHHGQPDTQLPEFLTGHIGLAADFDGQETGIQVTPTALLQPTQAVTVSAWINIHSTPPDWAHNKIVSSSRSPGPYGGYWLDIIPATGQYDPLHTRFVANTNSHEAVIGATKLSLNQWYHVVGVYDGENRYVFVNGELDGVTSAGSSLYYLSNSRFWIGKWHSGTFDGQIDEVRLYQRALSECEIKTLYTGQDECTTAVCQLYAVQDDGLNDSQFFTLNPQTLETQNLGERHLGYDIEALDIHPNTNVLYAASGDDTDNRGHLYTVDTQAGHLTDLGSTGFAEIEALTFHPDGELWAWAKGEGLILIDSPNDAHGTLMIETPVEVEGLTWNSDGTLLYAAQGTHLWVYNGQTLSQTCPLPGPTEALEMLPEDRLLIGIHGNNSILKLEVLDLVTCNLIENANIHTDYNDVEGIAWPTEACINQ